MSTRVFIVSAGLVTGAGGTISRNWEACSGGRDSFRSLEDSAEWLPFALDGLNGSLAQATVCPIRATDPQLANRVSVNPKGYDRHQLLALIAAKEAMRDIEGFNRSRFASIGATGGAGLNSQYQADARLAGGKKLGPRDNLKYLPNLFVGHLSRTYGLQGPSEVHGTACAASMHAIISLVRMIRCGEVDGGLVVGAEAAISPFGIASFQGQRALGNGHVYQTDRTGFVMGEGAGAVVIMSESELERFGLTPLCEITGYSASSDGVEEGAVTDPNPAGAAAAMSAALKMADLSLGGLSLVKAHGTATGKGDVSELQALHMIDGDAATDLPVVSLKSYIGHLLGAAGIAELIITLQMMQNDVMLPTRGLTNKNVDPDCNCVQHITMKRGDPVHKVLLNGFGFGGANASMVVEKV